MDRIDETISFWVEHLNRETTEETLQVGLQKLEKLSDQDLHSLLSSASLSPSFVTFLEAIFFGCDICSQTERECRRRKKCFEAAIFALKSGSLSQPKCQELVELLSKHSSQLYNEQLISLIDMVIDESHTVGASSLSYLLDVLPILVGDSIGCREHAVEKLYDMSWPSGLVLGFTSVLVALCSTETECERAMTKIMSYLCHGGRSDRSQVDRTAFHIEPEELPMLVYHLTSISKKCASSHLLKSSLLEVVAESLDTILASAVAEDGAVQSAENRRMTSVIATVTHHLTMLLTKDQSIADELLSLFKFRRLCTSQSLASHQHGSPMLSTSKMLLAMFASRAARNEMKVMTALTDLIQESFSTALLPVQSLWFQEAIWKKVIYITPHDVCEVFDNLLSNCSVMQLEGTTAPLVNLAFSLVSAWGDSRVISKGSLLRPGPSDSLLVKALSFPPPCVQNRTVGSNDSDPSSSGAFGAWLLCKLFIHSSHARSQIARELVLRLLIHAQISTASDNKTRVISGRDISQQKTGVTNMPPPSTGSAPIVGHSDRDQEVSMLCISVLENLATTCPSGVAEVAIDFQEAFAALPDLPSSTASRLVSVLSNFFIVSRGLSDRSSSILVSIMI